MASDGVSSDRRARLQARLADMERDAARLRRNVRIMEVCGTHTVALHRSGIRDLLADNVKLISGPGCPVCVTPTGYIDALTDLAARDNTLIATYGDMVRVPGSRGSLADARACGAHVSVVASATQAYQLARDHPDRDVIFAAVGFETTAPATADIIIRSQQAGVKNLSALCAHKLIIPAMAAILADPGCVIDAFLCPGHVSVIIGSQAYQVIVTRFARPCVVAGFEPMQMVEGIARIVAQLASNQARVENVYTAAVRAEPHERAWSMIEMVFDRGDAEWRSLGEIADSGLIINDHYRQFDAAERFGISPISPANLTDPGPCRCAEVIRGTVDPPQCRLFGNRCTPDDPVGPCMISSEGTCQAWYNYGVF